MAAYLDKLFNVLNYFSSDSSKIELDDTFAYWTGFYTTRPNLKDAIRKSS
jgi:hypothetical protein